MKKIITNKLFLFSFLYYIQFSLFSFPIEDCLRKIENKNQTNQIENIDFIYIINLDKRADRLKNYTDQLSIYNIYPHRFPAIFGEHLSAEDLNKTGLPLKNYTRSFHQWVLVPSSNGDLEYDFLRSSFCENTCFSPYMNRGAIGCALSHLSILQDAYDSNYNTIWIMEDDILIKDNPHKLSNIIFKLDSIIGEGNWDILYTDNDEHAEDTNISKDCWWMWRPDFPNVDKASFSKRFRVSNDFIKIASRTRTHSMVIRRSGIKKILDHIKHHGLFLPYDHEIAFATGIQLYMLCYPIVSWRVSPSDIQDK